MNIELLKEEIAAKRDVISKAKEYIRKTEQEIAEYLCPFSVGDRVISPEGTHQVIASIGYSGYGCGYSFKVFKIKKDGVPYKDSCHAYNLEKYVAA